MDKLRILVVDDHDDFRRGLRALLDATESLEVPAVPGAIGKYPT